MPYPAYFLCLLLSLPSQTASRFSDPDPVTIRVTDAPLSKVLSDLRLQTGIPLRNLLDRGDPRITLNLDRVSFWEAVDRIAELVRARTMLARDGSINLTPREADFRVPPTSYSGPFRTRLLRVSSTRDLDSTASRCSFALEVTWTPTLRPLFLDTQPHDVSLVTADGKSVRLPGEGSSLAAVDGRSTIQLDVITPGFPRKEERILSLDGKVNAVVPSKFLRFDFAANLPTIEKAPAGGAIRQLVQEEVICRIDRLVLGEDRWSVTIGLEYPPGGKILESFQASSLVVHNELTLIAQEGNRVLPSSNYVIDRISSRRAQVTYHFTDRPKLSRGSPKEWTLRYRAPARILEVPVTFRFKAIPLP